VVALPELWPAPLPAVPSTAGAATLGHGGYLCAGLPG